MKKRDIPRAWLASTQALRAAYDNGREAALKQLSRDCNPFDATTERVLHRRWDRGWRSHVQETGTVANLRNLREARGWTQREMGRRAGIGQTAISHYENGRRLPPAKVLHRLCTELGCTPEDLLPASREATSRSVAPLKGSNTPQPKEA